MFVASMGGIDRAGRNTAASGLSAYVFMFLPSSGVTICGDDFRLVIFFEWVNGAGDKIGIIGLLFGWFNGAGIKTGTAFQLVEGGTAVLG